MLEYLLDSRFLIWLPFVLVVLFFLVNVLSYLGLF